MLKMNLEPSAITTQPLDHLGLISAVVQDIGLETKIDSKLPVDTKMGAYVTMGKRVHAMILNGLGFVNTRLYMFSKFFENKPLARLLGEGVLAEHLNDDAIGRCLDSIYEYGCTKFYAEIASSIAIEQNLLGKSAHHDTTTISVEGEYESDDTLTSQNEVSNIKQPPKITHGYSKDHRHDLKQLTLLLTTTGKAGLPIWMEGLDGNASDKKTLKAAGERVDTFYKKIESAPKLTHIYDSAFYNQNVASADKMLWITRVPETLLESQRVVELPDDCISWVELENGYKMSAMESNYGNVLQRWLLIFSQKGYDREIKTLERQIKKEKSEIENQLWHLSNQIFQCPEDAKKSLEAFKNLKFHQIEGTTEPIYKHASRGRPKPGVEPQVTGYKVIGIVIVDDGKITQHKRKKGRFIVATNQMDKNLLSDKEILQEYKSQSQVEQGFKLIKCDDFQVSSVYLKKPSRIEALMVVMTLCLMVYNIAQHRLRLGLEANNETLPGPENRPVKRPTFNTVARVFQGVSVVKIVLDHSKNLVKELVSNVTAFLKRTMGYFGQKAFFIYGVT
jgi:transposase